MPPRGPVHPGRFGPGQESAPGRPQASPGYPAQPGPGYAAPGAASYAPPGGPGYAPPGGRRPAPPGTPFPGAPIPPEAPYAGVPGAPGTPVPPGGQGTSAPRGSYGTFDGGYAQVIRPADHLVPPPGRVRPPHSGNPGDPARPSRPVGRPSSADADVFVYRDTSAPPDRPAAGRPARELTEHDAAYWYDLLAEDATPRHEEARGPFEPLVSSDEPDPAHGPPAAAAMAEPALSDDAARARARKLEQLKDLYLTAEAIGEQNVDKHFDQLLAQQRELISEYFQQPTGTTATGATTPAPGAPPAVAGPRDGQAADDTEPGTGVAAERPRAW